jgi:hypothetical protein
MSKKSKHEKKRKKNKKKYRDIEIAGLVSPTVEAWTKAIDEFIAAINRGMQRR